MTAMHSAQRQSVNLGSLGLGEQRASVWLVACGSAKQKKAPSEDGAHDWAEAKSKVGQRAREEDMHSANEP
jgi:hypothetical protein